MSKTLKLNLIAAGAALAGLLALGWLQSRRRGELVGMVAGVNGDGPAGEPVELEAVAPGSG